jgi:hypothetical protein
MATSNVTTFQMTRNEFIEAALRKLGVLAEGVTANATQITTGQQAANLVIKAMQTLGMQAWKKTSTTVAMVADQISYSIAVPFPLKIEQAYLTTTTGSVIDIEIVSNYNFNLLPNSASGTPIQTTYIPNLTTGNLKMWPAPDVGAVSSYTFNIVSQKPFDVFTASTETIDLAEEWQLAMVYKLAHVLADDYQLPLEDKTYLGKQAETYISTAQGFGTEDTSSYFYPQRR